MAQGREQIILTGQDGCRSTFCGNPIAEFY